MKRCLHMWGPGECAPVAAHVCDVLIENHSALKHRCECSALTPVEYPASPVQANTRRDVVIERRTVEMVREEWILARECTATLMEEAITEALQHVRLVKGVEGLGSDQVRIEAMEDAIVVSVTYEDPR